MIRVSSRIAFGCLLLLRPLVSWNFSSDSQRLLSGDYTFNLSASGALSSLEKKGTPRLRSPGTVVPFELILGTAILPLKKPVRVEKTANAVRFACETESLPPFKIEIGYRISPGQKSTRLTRELTVFSPSKLDSDLTVRLPLTPLLLPDQTWLPYKNGVGAPLGKQKAAAYKFAGALRSDGIPLAVPMVSFESKELGERCTIVTDPYFSTLFTRDFLEWTYPKSVGLEGRRESRLISIIFHSGTPDEALAEFFNAALGDVPPGPAWLHDIAMVDYDYLSDGGRGWFKDIDALAAAISEPDRQKVLLCLHGWYDFVGRYCFDRAKGKLENEWTAFSNYANVKDRFPNSEPVRLTLRKMHERLAYARSRGFRVALYFADGMNAGDGVADIYRPEHVLYWGGWQGPDTWGKTYVQNPLCPEVRSFFLDYIKVLLREYGNDVDALVWDETFHVPEANLGNEAFSGYADRVMMHLVKDLTAEVRAFNQRAGRELAFLASDCIGVFNWVTKAPYALVADGTYQDSHCAPESWSYGTIPNLRNVLWSCNWSPVSRWDYTEFGVRNYQAAVAISNGYGDDTGFAEMSTEMRHKVLALFDWRKRFSTRLRWFEKLPVYIGKPVLVVETASNRPALTFLSWDTEGGDKAGTNLLRPDAGANIQVQAGGAWQDVMIDKRRVESGVVRYDLRAGKAKLSWEVKAGDGNLRLILKALKKDIASARVVFPFDPKVTPTSVLPSVWQENGVFLLPAVINAPDFGPMRLREADGREVHGRVEGSREKKTVDIILELPEITKAHGVVLILEPLALSPPPGLKESDLWLMARRGWLNALQPCARWGDQARPFSAPPGILGNNVISDPASVSLWFYADQAYWMPQVAEGISLAPLVRRTIDYWLDKRMRSDTQGRLTGEITGYWDYGNFLDANASPLIASWDYVESTGDTGWLEKRIDRLEMVADFLAGRDTDRDGMVEATQSGNRGTLLQPNRSCAWWDALNCGHKDGYTNALIYRAWRCLADLEKKLGRAKKQVAYTRLADRLKAAYSQTLYNPKTGWLAWWKSRDGELHDYASPTLNGLAIEYGLVEPGLGRQILDRLWKKLDEVGFRRFDLGIPPMLIPVRRSDYLLPDAIGIPQREDGTDTFGQYMNGGITAGHVLHFLAAHYILEEPERADRVLRAMLERQMRGEFQNGVRDAGGQGIDWTTWDGKPSGYEGYLADSFRFLQAVLLREKQLREKVYNPINQ